MSFTALTLVDGLYQSENLATEVFQPPLLVTKRYLVRMVLSAHKVNYLAQQCWLTLHTSGPSIHSVSNKVRIEVLHARISHLSWSALWVINGEIDSRSKHALSTCEGCLLGKSTRWAFKTLTNSWLKPFKLVHMDLVRPMRMRSLQRNAYHLIIVDDFTHFNWVFFLRSEDQAFDWFKTYVAFISTQFSTALYAAHLDQGGEFLSPEFTSFMETKGILHQLTAQSITHQCHSTCTPAKRQRAILDYRTSNDCWRYAILRFCQNSLLRFILKILYRECSSPISRPCRFPFRYRSYTVQ